MLISTVSTLLSLAALISASPLEIRADLPPPRSSNSSEVISLTDTEIHANVLANYPPERIITSDQLEDYLSKNGEKLAEDENKSIYLSDKHSWVITGAEPDPSFGNHSIEARQSCSWTRERAVVFAHPYWAPWHAVSSCLKSGANPAGGYLTISYEENFSVSYSGGLTIAGFEGALGASLGFTITYGFAEQRAFSCNVAGGDTVQIWASHAHGWTYMKERLCQSCLGGGSSCAGWSYGYVNAPASTSMVNFHKYGCSAKSKSYLKGC